jgi:hypothetical protein
VQLRGEAAAHAARPVGDLHAFGLLSGGEELGTPSTSPTASSSSS